MQPLAKLIGVALMGAFALLAAPAARAQVGVNVTIGAPAWGPQVPYGTQYYYIPEIDGYYDLYAQQYIVYQDGYWVPLPQLYGYDPYQFHPVIVDYRGPQPWSRIGYYRQHYAYQPYRSYGPGRASYYNGGYGYGHPRTAYYSNGRGYGDHNRDDRGGYRGGQPYPGGGGTYPPRGDQHSQQGGGGYNPGQGQGNHGGGQPQPGGDNGGGRGNNGGGSRGGHGRS